MNNFRENLIRYRKLKYASARQFALALGIPYKTYMTYESAIRPAEPKYEMLIKIASLLGVSTDELLGYVPVKNDLENTDKDFQTVKEIETLLNRVRLLSLSFLHKK